ncbi:MAG TPA: segregation/condensation protein A [Firmicutes bacterium]|nr:segregation/condensation protein A [Bacillota bacterium]
MANAAFEYHASDSLKFSLGDFEGPIALLYTLIVEEGKYQIDNFPISEITGQYMEYMKQLDTVDMDVAADFMAMAATLLEIKSRSVLPPEVEDDAYMDDGDEWIEDPRERLEFQLKLYEIFKRQSEKLRGLETTNRFMRDPQFTEEDAKVVIKSFNLEKLIDAYGKILFNFSDDDRRTTTKKIARDTYTVAEKIVYITTVLSEKKSVEFSQLFTSVYNKSEVIATFSALLELMKKQVAKAEQKELFGEIYITLDENFDISKADMRELVKIDEEEGNN